MILDNFKCDNCEHIWTESKSSVEDEYNVTECPACGYKKKDENDKTIYKKYTAVAIDVAEGRLGNAKTGYNNGTLYTPSKFSTGKTFKNSAKLKEKPFAYEHLYK